MAFETRTLVNGQWTTGTMTVNAVLQHYDQKEKEASMARLAVEKAPFHGILTQTVIRSPLVHWILPARLRSSERNDVAFIGDDFVQIKELRPDRQLWDVARKENFGARIRNARVVGSMKVFHRERSSPIGSVYIKEDEDDVAMDVGETLGVDYPRKELSLPPQILVLQLETGDSVFLMLQQSATGDLEFISGRHRVPKPMLRLQPGMHLAIDPSSRYMAIGCSEALFAIYGLYSREELSQHYRQGHPLRHVEFEKHISVPGVILKMEFLHPSPDDEEHIILLVLVIIRGKTRMQVYEWQTGTDLKNVHQHSTRGHLLEERRWMPLLLIPLMIKSSFILIYENFMSVCHGILEGNPVFTDFSGKVDSPTKLHHGKGNPIWTAWARPTRREAYTIHHDDIYIVREDGIVKFVEIDSEDTDFVKAEMNVGDLESNCGAALAYLDYKHYGSKNGDVLVTGGDSGAGGTYFLQARRSPLFTEPIQNWSPASDLTTTFTHQVEGLRDKWAIPHRKRDALQTPGKLFASVGKGVKGAITEFRRGFEAKLGLVMDYGTPIMDAWVLCPTLDSFDADDESLFLLSLGGRSAVLCLSGDANNITDLDENETKFDLRYRTITASMHRSRTTQVTDESIVIMNGAHVHVYEKNEIMEICLGSDVLGCGTAIDKAVVHEDLVLFTTMVDNSTYLQILEQSHAFAMETDDISHIQPTAKVRTLVKFSHIVTSIGICLVDHGLCAIVVEERGSLVVLTFVSIQEGNTRELIIPATDSIHLAAIVSVCVATTSAHSFTILCGTRNGWLVTLKVDNNSFELLSSRYDRFGGSQVLVRKDEHSASANLFFVICDSNIFGLTPSKLLSSTSSTGESISSWVINKIWLTDASRPELNQPELNSVARLRPNLSGGADGGLLLVSGSQLLLAAFSTQAKAVPRHLQIGGTPSRLLYSHYLDLLIVAAIVDGRTTLRFIDNDTSEDLSAPWDEKTKEPVDYISGLGHSNERIFHLLEWPYSKDGKTWHFIIVSTSSGRLLIIAATPEKSPPRTETHSSNGHSPEKTKAKIRFYTRYKFKCDDPIFSVVGFPDGLIWCSGNYLYCDTLDLKEKKFKRVAEYELPSPATSLTYENGNIYALTNCHSLEVIKLVTPDDDDDSELVHTHADQVVRNTLHHAVIEGFSDRPLHVVSDKDCSIAGLWATQDTRADTLDTVFEAQLPHSILRFRLGKCRPIWDQVWTSNSLDSRPVKALRPDTSYALARRLPNGPELFGLSIDGSLSHFTILEERTWKFLRFLIDLAIRSSQVCEFTYKDDTAPLEPVTNPKIMMHVDGDILKRCLEDQSLEGLLKIGQNTADATRIFAKFSELMEELHQGMLGENVAAFFYVEQAYQDLDFLLRPVL